jgi:hypothetical protein
MPPRSSRLIWLGACLHFASQDGLKNVPVAMPLLVSAMAHQRDGLAIRQLLKQAEREFLAVIFDGAIAVIKASAFKQFRPITTSELGPCDPASQCRAQ